MELQHKKINKFESLNKLIMGIINTLFTGIGALFIGILLGFIIAGIIGAIIYGIVKLRERLQKE